MKLENEQYLRTTESKQMQDMYVQYKAREEEKALAVKVLQEDLVTRDNIIKGLKLQIDETKNVAQAAGAVSDTERATLAARVKELQKENEALVVQLNAVKKELEVTMVSEQKKVLELQQLQQQRNVDTQGKREFNE